MAKQGGYIFISHSHQDIVTVRKIRNQLEALGYEPLLFYLKCLNDEDEIETLIKREIDEREWFVYVDSENARNSKWVASERAYIATLPNKKIITIDSNGNIEEQVDTIAKSLTVYLSHNGRDLILGDRIAELLLSHDYLVHRCAWNQGKRAVKKQIKNTVETGFFIFLVSETGINVYREWELYAAKAKGGMIVPVFIGNATLPNHLLKDFGELQGVHLSEMPSDAELLKILSEIEQRIHFYHSRFENTIGFQNAVTIKYPYVASVAADTFVDCPRLRAVAFPRCVSFIDERAFDPEQNILIVAEPDSYAAAFAEKHGMPLELTASVDTYRFS